MNVIIFRALPIATALALLVGVHGAELLSTAAEIHARSGGHDCGCADECGCRGPVKGCNCSSQGTSIKARCGCGCSEPMHRGGATTWESVLTGSCSVGAPILDWSFLSLGSDIHAWRLAFEHEHPPRYAS
jgi:hypothetical protein